MRVRTRVVRQRVSPFHSGSDAHAGPAIPATTTLREFDATSPITSHYSRITAPEPGGRGGGVGRPRGVGRDRGVTLGVALGVGLPVGVPGGLGVGRGVAVAFGVTVGVGVGVGVPVGNLKA